MRLFDNSALHGEPWIIASELHHGIKDIQLLCGAPLDERRLHADFPERFIQHDVIRWETDKRALVAQRESCFDRIVLDMRPPDALISTGCKRINRSRTHARPGYPLVDRTPTPVAGTRCSTASLDAGA